MEQLSKKIKVIGFIMTCFMVFYHSGNYDNSLAINSFDSWCNTAFNYIFSTMGGVVMSWFFTVTGFLLFYGLSFATYAGKIKRRCFSLLIPYIIWQFLIAFLNMSFSRSQYSIKGFLYQNFALVQWPCDGPLWYMYAVFLLAILSVILIPCFKNRNVGFIVIIILIIFIQYRENITNNMFQAIINHGYIPNILFYLPAYLVGTFYGRFYEELRNEEALRYVFCILFASYLLYGVNWGSIALLMLPILGLYLIPNPRISTSLSIFKLTFLIYALHLPVISLLRPSLLNLISLFMNSAFLINALSHIFILLADIVISAIIYFCLKRICPLLLTLLTGGRI